MRDYIIAEIQRLAGLNGGQAPGQQAFANATGLSATKWRGKFWARWGDALVEAGFQPNQWAGRTAAETIIAGVVIACRHYGRFPTAAEIQMLRQTDQRVPASNVIKNNIGGRSELITALAKHVADDHAYADVQAMLPQIAPRRATPPKTAKPVDGHVYLIRYGDAYKVGRSDDLERRVKEIRTLLPDKGILVHVITTDDPPGIEACWHRRFADRRANGEWFMLATEDVKAFMRRKFQ